MMLPRPFKILYELFVFGIQAAFIYGILLIASIVFLIWVIADLREPAKAKKYETKPAAEVSENIEMVKENVIIKPKENVTIRPKEKELVCERIEGCATFPNAPTRKEYCPTCVFK